MRGVVKEGPVLNSGAASLGRRYCAPGSVSVDNGAKAEELGFAAGGLELFVAHALAAAIANALGCEEFDDVGTALLEFADG